MRVAASHCPLYNHLCALTGSTHLPSPLSQVRQALAKVPDEVLSKYYGCGSPLPMGIEGLR